MQQQFKYIAKTHKKQHHRRAMTHLAMEVTGLKRVVVTGMGIVSCLGNTLDDVKESLYNCEPGITFSEECKELGIKSQVRGIPSLPLNSKLSPLL